MRSCRQRAARGALVLTLAVVLAGLARGVAVLAVPAGAETTPDLSSLPITFPVQSASVAAYFDEVARPGDIASFPQIAIRLIPEVHTGEKMVVYSSWADAEAGLPTLGDSIDAIMYNPEHSQQTPADEQADLVGTVRRAAEAVHERGLRFAFAPDRRFAEEYLVEVAPHVDMVLLQGQRLQAEPDEFAAWVLARGEEARGANPDVKVFVQVGANRGSADEMLEALRGVAGTADGLAIWSVPRTLGTLADFVALVRPAPPATEGTVAASGEPAVTQGGGTALPRDATALPGDATASPADAAASTTRAVTASAAASPPMLLATGVPTVPVTPSPAATAGPTSALTAVATVGSGVGPTPQSTTVDVLPAGANTGASFAQLAGAAVVGGAVVLAILAVLSRARASN